MTRRLFLSWALVLLWPVVVNAAALQDRDSVIVTVNGKAITEGDLEFLYLSRRVPQNLRDSVRERFIQQLVDRALLRTFLAERKLKPSQLLVDQHVRRIENLVKRENLKLDDVLKSLGYTRKTFRDEVALPLTWQQHAKLVLTEKVMQEYFRKHRTRFDGTEVRAAHIVKKIPADATASVVETLRMTLSGLRGKIVTDEMTFEEAARLHSESPSSKDGGNLGFFPYSGRMPVEFSRAAFALKKGEISEPFQTRFGIHVLTVVDTKPGDLSFEDARRDVFSFLSEELQTRLLRQLREKAKIEWPSDS